MERDTWWRYSRPARREAAGGGGGAGDALVMLVCNHQATVDRSSAIDGRLLASLSSMFCFTNVPINYEQPQSDVQYVTAWVHT